MQSVSADYLTAVVAKERNPITEAQISLLDNENIGAGISVTADEKDSSLHAKGAAVDAVKSPPRQYAFAASRVFPGSTLYPLGQRSGWWGNSASDANGYISGGEQIELDYNGTVDVLAVGWWADDYLGRPLDWTVEWYDGAAWNEIGNETGYTQESWLYEFPATISIYKLRMTITRVNYGSSYAKLLELEAGLSVDISSIVDSWEIMREREHAAETSPVGNVSVNELSINLDNTTRDFFRKSTSLYAPYMLANRKITVKAGFTLADGTRELLQQGIFYTRGWDASEDAPLIKITAWDRAKLMQERKYSTSTVLEGYTISGLITYLAEDFGINTGDMVIDATAETIDYAWFSEASYWYHLRNLAAAAGGVLYFDEHNRLRFENLSHLAAVTTSVATISDLNATFNVRESWDQTKMRNHIQVPAKPLTPAASQEIYQFTETFSIPAGGSVTLKVVFSAVPSINVSTPVVTAGPNIGIDVWTAYAWGGSLVLGNSGGSPENVSQVTINGQPLEMQGGVIEEAEDTTSVDLNGRRTYTVPDEAAQYIQSRSVAQTMAAALLNGLVDPGDTRDVQMRGRPELELADRLTVQNTRLNLDDDMWLLRARLQFDRGLLMEATLLES